MSKCIQRTIEFKTIYRKITGSTNSALILSQLMELWSYFKHREFYKTNEELCEETGLSINELKAAKSNLIKLGFINVQRKGTDGKTNYTIMEDNISDAILGSQNSTISLIYKERE